MSEGYGMERVLADAVANTRRIAAASGVSRDPDVYGAHCFNCNARWCLPADQATCAHKPICEDCWPNGCADCEAEVEQALRRRELLVHEISTACETLHHISLDLADSDLAALPFQHRNDLLAHTERGLEAVRSIHDRTAAKGARP